MNIRKLYQIMKTLTKENGQKSLISKNNSNQPLSGKLSEVESSIFQIHMLERFQKNLLMGVKGKN